MFYIIALIFFLLNITSLFTMENYDVNQRDHYGRTALYHACFSGDEKKVKELLADPHIDVNLNNSVGETPLFLARNNPTIAKLLLAHPKINPNVPSPTWSPLHMASCAVTELLLTHPKINPNKRDGRGNTPLFWCADSTGIQLERANILINNGKVNIYKKNFLKQTFFYTLYHEATRDNPAQDVSALSMLDTFKKCTPQEKIDFMNEQLYAAATMHATNNDMIAYKRMDKRTHIEGHVIHPVNPFITFCVFLGANLNQRNKEGKRAVDLAEELYRNAITCCPYNSAQFQTKETLYFSFLQQTPYMNDAQIWNILKGHITIDIFKKIMGFYSACTLDRIIACTIKTNPTYSQDPTFYSNYHDYYTLNPSAKKKYRKLILNYIYGKFGYINPWAGQGKEKSR